MVISLGESERNQKKTIGNLLIDEPKDNKARPVIRKANQPLQFLTTKNKKNKSRHDPSDSLTSYLYLNPKKLNY